MALFFCLLILTLPEAPATVLLRFGGDCLLAASYEADVGSDVNRAFARFPLLREADMAMVNLECPVTQRGAKIHKPYNFRMHRRFLGALTSAGVDIVNIANNHIFDYGRDGLFDTVTALDSAGILHVGAGRDAREAYAPVVRVVNGRKLGFLGYYGGGEAPVAVGSRPGVARREITRIISDIRALRQRDSVTYVVVSLHWGTELAPRPDPGQRDMAHRIIDAGADAVIGHHPHVLQGIELYRNGVIAYSLGNFIFGGNSTSTYDTGLLEIKLGEGAPAYRFLPVRVERWSARALNEEQGRRITSVVQERSKIFRKSIFQTNGAQR
jgi:poly-gamma-glutamate capsule biosynthesis protein CapA/YwtB (metallophosphatase superfamily)